MNKTAIVWTDFSWNLWSGCTPVSEGCRYCYARTLAERLRGSPGFPNGFELTMRPHKLREPARLNRKVGQVDGARAMVFVCSTSDFFYEAVGDATRELALEAMTACTNLTFQVLTKRPSAAQEYFTHRPVPPNVWLGVTVENASHYDRIDRLVTIDAPIRFISAEPLLGELNDLPLDGIDWVIVGGESGQHLQDKDTRLKRSLVCKPLGKWVPRGHRMDWVRSIRDQCDAADVAFLFKQWGGLKPHSAGRTLDGRTYTEYPTQKRPCKETP
uniref:Uncharacterized protein n=1 Tax=viral metagenome TaxID=1070528 RepID=A0A6M3LL05_9ZZZZ